MRYFIFIFFSFISFCSFCQAPTIQWTKLFGDDGFDGDKGLDRDFEVLQTADKGSIIAAGTYSTGSYMAGNHGDEDIFVVKLNAKNKPAWYKCLGGSGGEYPTNLKQTYDKGYIITGLTTSVDGDVTFNHGQADVWVVKLDGKGDIVWQKTFGGSGGDHPRDVQQTKDSGYIISAYTFSSDGDITQKLHGLYNAWFIKLDKNGSIEWQELFGGNCGEIPYSIQQTFDGGYVAAGLTCSSDMTGYHGYWDGWVLKMDSSGVTEWAKCIGGSGYDVAKSIKQTADSGYIVAMFSNSNNGDVPGNHGLDDYLLVKLNKNGDIMWRKCYGGSNFEIVHDILIIDGNYLLTGISNSSDGDVSGNHGGIDGWILKTDSSGNIIWQTSLGAEGDDESFSTSYKKGIGYLVGGHTNSYSINHKVNDYDIWLVKLNDDIVLPVTLLSFTAQKQNNKSILHWQTTNEINNSHFDIERSADSKAFYSIGKVSASGSSNLNYYSFTDNAPLTGMNYYRLRQVDNDARFTYSNIAAVEFKKTDVAFSLSPNPANEKVTVTIPAGKSGSEIIFYDAAGRKVTDEHISGNITSKQFNISKLPEGVYTIVLIQDGARESVKMIKVQR